MGQLSRQLLKPTVCHAFTLNSLSETFYPGDRYHDDDTHAQDNHFGGESAILSSSTAPSIDEPSETWPANDVAGVVLAKTPCMFVCISYPLFSLTLNNQEKEYPASVHELAAYLGQPDLHEHIRRFLYWQLHPDDNNTDVLLTLCPDFDSDISVFHSATSTFHSPSDPNGARGMHHEVIWSTPCWCNEDARRDCVFVECDAEAQGMRGLDVVHVLAFFSFITDGIHYPSALVQWFTRIGEELDDLMGMWMVRAEQSMDGSPAVSVIHTDCILRGAHLIPVFGPDSIPSKLHFSESLDAFAAFYVNRFIDHHAFEILF